jgi:hypothetical protein
MRASLARRQKDTTRTRRRRREMNLHSIHLIRIVKIYLLHKFVADEARLWSGSRKCGK